MKNKRFQQIIGTLILSFGLASCDSDSKSKEPQHDVLQVQPKIERVKSSQVRSEQESTALAPFHLEDRFVLNFPGELKNLEVKASCQKAGKYWEHKTHWVGVPEIQISQLFSKKMFLSEDSRPALCEFRWKFQNSLGSIHYHKTTGIPVQLMTSAFAQLNVKTEKKDPIALSKINTVFFQSQLLFSPNKIEKVIEVKSACRLDSKLHKKTVKWVQPESLFLFQILPRASYFLKNGKINCDLSLSSFDESGLALLTKKISSLDIKIDETGQGVGFQHKDRGVLESLQFDSSELNELTAISQNQDPIYFEPQCLGRDLKTMSAQTRQTPLSELGLLSPQITEGKNRPAPSLQLCRLLGLNDLKQTILISPLFEIHRSYRGAQFHYRVLQPNGVDFFTLTSFAYRSIDFENPYNERLFIKISRDFTVAPFLEIFFQEGAYNRSEPGESSPVQSHLRFDTTEGPKASVETLERELLFKIEPLSAGRIFVQTNPTYLSCESGRLPIIGAKLTTIPIKEISVLNPDSPTQVLRKIDVNDPPTTWVQSTDRPHSKFTPRKAEEIGCYLN